MARHIGKVLMNTHDMWKVVRERTDTVDTAELGMLIEYLTLESVGELILRRNLRPVSDEELWSAEYNGISFDAHAAKEALMKLCKHLIQIKEEDGE